MNYEKEHWIKVYTRDTGSWMAVSWQARGLALEIARRLPKATGELSLGRKGLPAIAALVRATWSEIEPFILELIADGRLVYDEARQVIADPQHVERQNALTGDAERKRQQRERDRVLGRDVTPSPAVTESHAPSRDVTPGHEEKRREEKEEIRSMSPSGPDEVWEHYVAVVKRHRPRRRPGLLSADDRKKIVNRLKTFSVEDLKAACTGLFRSAHHLGQNDRETEYLELEYALRKPAQMMALAAEHDTPPATAPPPASDLVDPATIAAALETLEGIGVA